MVNSIVTTKTAGGVVSSKLGVRWLDWCWWWYDTGGLLEVVGGSSSITARLPPRTIVVRQRIAPLIDEYPIESSSAVVRTIRIPRMVPKTVSCRQRRDPNTRTFTVNDPTEQVNRSEAKALLELHPAVLCDY